MGGLLLMVCFGFRVKEMKVIEIQFEEVKASDAGNYTLLARNHYLNTSISFQLIVNGMHPRHSKHV